MANFKRKQPKQHTHSDGGWDKYKSIGNDIGRLRFVDLKKPQYYNEYGKYWRYINVIDC